MRVLIADDAKEIVMVLTMMLKSASPELEIISVQEHFNNLIERTDWDNIDAILIDRHLEEIDGSDILKWLSIHHPSIRRIMLTGDSYVKKEDMFAHILLIKPVTLKEIEEVLL